MTTKAKAKVKDDVAEEEEEAKAPPPPPAPAKPRYPESALRAHRVFGTPLPTGNGS